MKIKTKINNVILNSITGTAYFIVNVIIMLFLSPLIIRTLGNSKYGIWEIMISLTGYMGVLDLGISSAVVRYVSVYYENNDPSELKCIISTSFFFFLVASILSVFILYIISIKPDILFGVNINNIYNISTLIIIFGFNIGITFIYILFTSLLIGTQRHYVLNITRIAISIASGIILYMLLTRYSENGLIVMAGLDSASKIIQLIIFLLVISFDKNIPGISISGFSFKYLNTLLKYGSKNMLMMLSSRIQNQSIPFIISYIIGIQYIVYFSITSRLIEYSKGLSNAIGFPLTPYFGSIIGRGDSIALRNNWVKTSLGLHIFTVCMPIILLFFGFQFLGIWLGQGYAENSRWVLYILLCGAVFEAITPNASRILMATAHHGTAAVIWLIISLASIPITIYFAKHFGISGVAISVSIALIINSFITLFLACKDMDITLIDYLDKTVRPFIIPIFSIIVSFFILKYFNISSGYMSLAIKIAIGGLIYLVAVWFYVLNNDVRRRIIDIFQTA